MTNDLTTVEGSFQQLIDDLENNLQEKGVDAEYDATTGIRGLVAKILDIECNSSSGNVVARVIGNNVSLGKDSSWLITTGDVVINWGDGTSDTVNNPFTRLSHTYNDGLNEHLIIFDGTVTSLGDECFRNCSGLTSIVIPDSVTSFRGWCFYGCSGLTSIVIPDSVTSLGNACFGECSGLTSIVIPDSVTSLGNWCFYGCTSLVDYELYWETQPVTYDSDKMPVNNGTVFTIPHGTTSVYTDAGYPSNNLVERGETLTLTCDKPIIQKTETSTVTATLKQSGSPLTGKTLSYTVKHGTTTISSGTKTTNNQGQATISYTGTGVGDVDIVVSYGTLLQETYEVQDCIFYDPLTSNSGKWTIPSGVSFGYNEYSSDGWKIGNASSFVRLDPNVSLTLPCKVSFKLMDRYSYTPQLDVGNDYVEFNDTHLNINETNLYATISNNKEYSFIIRSDSIEAYQDDTYLGKVNISISQTNLRLSVGNNRYFKIKDFKVKAL